MKKFYNAPELIKEEFVAIDSIMDASLVTDAVVDKNGANDVDPF